MMGGVIVLILLCAVFPSLWILVLPFLSICAVLWVVNGLIAEHARVKGEQAQQKREAEYAEEVRKARSVISA